MNGPTKALHGIVGQYRKPADALQQDLLYAIDVCIGDDTFSEFYLVTAVAFRGGVQQASESYVRLHPSSSEGETFLHLTTADYVQTDKSWPGPIDRASCGTIKTLSTNQLAAHIVLIESDLSNGCTLGSSRLPDKVTIQEFEFRDASRSVLLLTVAAEKPATVITSAKSGTSGSKEPPGPSSPDANRLDMLDLFADLESCHKQGKREQTRERKGKGHAGQKKAGKTAEHDDYAEFQEELRQQMLEALDLPLDSASEHSNTAKWMRDFAGLLDSDQLDVLKEERGLKKLVNSSLTVVES